MRSLLLCTAACSLLANFAFAEITPARGALDSRVRVTPYTDGQVYSIRTSLTRATTVEFEEGERIVSIVAGDTDSFLFESIPGDRVFAIKPTASGVRTNVTVYTNQRSYYFTLVEGGSAFYVVRFSYPERQRQQAGARPVRETSGVYGVNASNEITPLSIWDDGAFTYFRFRENAPIPAIFKVTNGLERSVNSQVVDGTTVRVSGTALQWVVRLGEAEVCIVEIFQ